MTPFGELPQWMDLGPDQDFTAPTADIVSLLKKRMNRKPEAGIGTEAGRALGENGIIASPTSDAKGVKSL